MPLFALTYRYVTDGDVVAEHRPEHRRYLATLHEKGDLLVAGPLGEPGAAGGLLILGVDSADRVDEIADADPFHAHGVVVERTVQSWTPSFGGDRFPEQS